MLAFTKSTILCSMLFGLSSEGWTTLSPSGTPDAYIVEPHFEEFKNHLFSLYDLEHMCPRTVTMESLRQPVLILKQSR